MWRTLAGGLLAVLLVTGCGEKEPEQPVDAPPPPPTAQQIHGEFRQVLQVLDASVGSNVDLVEPQRMEVVNAFSQVRGQHSQSINGPEALQMVKRDVEGMISRARTAELWQTIKAGIEIYKSIDPANTRYAQLEERADLMNSRPTVEVMGFMTVDGVLNASLRVTDTLAADPRKQVQTYFVRESEEFHDQVKEGKPRPVLKLIRIIGNQQAVEVEFIPINDSWEIMGPRG